MPDQVLRRATLPDGRVCDVRLRDGSISSIDEVASPQSDQSGQSGQSDTVVDLSGHVLLPAPVEPHAHLDKAFLAETIENRTGDLLGAIDAMRSSRDLLSVDETIIRAERAARLLAANGYSAVRTHADTTSEHGLTSVHALTEVRRRVADLIDIEIVALCGWPVGGPPGADHRALLHEALAVGADLVGGCPHLDDDIERATDALLDIAAEHGRPVDLHTDETLDPAANGLDVLARRVLAGFGHGATASHCVSLGQQDPATQRATADRVAEAGVHVVVLPHTNLFLQGRSHSPMPRGLTAIELLRNAGVNVAAGADNLQDPFNPLGRGCPFETAGLMILAAHELPQQAWESVSTCASRVIGRVNSGLQVGARADLLAVRAASVREAIAFGPPERFVWRRGMRLGHAPSRQESTPGSPNRYSTA